MNLPPPRPNLAREPLGALFLRLKDDGVRLVRAHVDVYKLGAIKRVNAAKTSVVLLVVAVFLAQAALTTILVGLAFGLAKWIGPAGGGLVVGVIVFAICGILAKIAVGGLSVAFGSSTTEVAAADRTGTDIKP